MDLISGSSMDMSSSSSASFSRTILTVRRKGKVTFTAGVVGAAEPLSVRDASWRPMAGRPPKS
jgi:hypothetical protein